METFATVSRRGLADVLVRPNDAVRIDMRLCASDEDTDSMNPFYARMQGVHAFQLFMQSVDCIYSAALRDEAPSPAPAVC